MKSRSMSEDGYRFGFNGKENDTDFGNGQLIQDYGFRVYNPALGKFLSVDPLSPDFPWYTPYQFAGNKPIWATDLDGLEENITTRRKKYFPYKGVLAIDFSMSIEGGLGLAGRALHGHAGIVTDAQGNVALYHSTGRYWDLGSVTKQRHENPEEYHGNGGFRTGEWTLGADVTFFDGEIAYEWDVNDVWEYQNTTDITVDFSYMEGTFVTKDPSTFASESFSLSDVLSGFDGIKMAVGFSQGLAIGSSQTELSSMMVVHRTDIPDIMSAIWEAEGNAMRADPPSPSSLYGISPAARSYSGGSVELSSSFSFEESGDTYRLIIQGLNNGRPLGDSVDSGIDFNKTDKGFESTNIIK